MCSLFSIQINFQWIEKTYEPKSLVEHTTEKLKLVPLAVEHLENQLLMSKSPPQT